DRLKEKAKGYLQAQPVKFLENKGQMMDVNSKPVPFVLFKAEAPGMNVYITEKGLMYVFVKAEEEEHEREREKEKEREKGMLAGPEEENVKMEMAWVNVNLEGANIQRNNIIKEGQSTEHFNYFYSHCPNGIYDVYQYDKITIKDVYPGIDWVFYNSQKTGMKYDFVVHPGAEASQIKLIYEGEKPLKMEEDGSISIKTKLGTLTEAKPYTYEEGNNNEIQSNYKLTTINKNKTLLEFDLANHNTNNTLIIDPQLNWGTFFGGNALDGPQTIETDNSGNVYVAGYVNSPNFPIQMLIGAYNQTILGAGTNGDAFLIKFSNSGLLLWSTFYGGATADEARSLAIDGGNNVYMAGRTAGSFPTQTMLGAYNDLSYNGGFYDAFLVKFNSSGQRVWATYYGGSNTDDAYSLGIDGNNNVYMGGVTQSNNFPVQNLGGAYNDPSFNGGADAFISKFLTTGSLNWSTYYGGTGADACLSLTIDSNNNIYIAGNTDGGFPTFVLIGAYNDATFNGSWSDGFIVKFLNNGSLNWSTYFGGNLIDMPISIACDFANNLYLVGYTNSTSAFPIQNLAGAYNVPFFTGVRNAFITRFNITGALVWSTYYGGVYQDLNTYDNLAIDNCGNVYLAFYSYGLTDPTQMWQSSCGGYNDISFNGGTTDNFLVRFSQTGSLTWATYIAGDGNDHRSPIALDNSDNLFISGEWGYVVNNATYPLANPGGGAYYDPTFNGTIEDGFIMKFTPIPPTYAQSQTNPSACNCNGLATISVTCGEAPYTYQWSN
ncbi:MAG: SBBP repeat-containing protein, partial [Sphingobacteriaceae bacterium]